MPASPPIIVWFRQDLRLSDNPALIAACASGQPIIPLFMLDETPDADWPIGAASRWWLHHSLQSLSRDLAQLGSKLILRRGPASRVLSDLLSETDARLVLWNRLYEPAAIARDTAIKSDLNKHGVDAKSFNSALLREPWDMKTGSGGPYQVFTPFFRALKNAGPIDTLVARPRALTSPAVWPRTDSLDSWSLLPRRPNWAVGFETAWVPGETGAYNRLTQFLDHSVGNYSDARNIPGVDSTSRLSPHLHFGEISPRQIWAAAQMRADQFESGTDKFLSEIGWREFSYHLLYHFPNLTSVNLRREFDVFPWRNDDVAFKAWTRGKTGFPIVDAGMRELWATGWMHNRVRMIVASFLIKNLMIVWRRGASWFWNTLVDADLASNSASWQWVAGCGADAAPYFRIFNPVLQGQKFDADGHYVKRWIPELARLPTKYIHAPWDAPPAILAASGIALGETYPKPIVDLGRSRDRALAAFASLKSAA